MQRQIYFQRRIAFAGPPRERRSARDGVQNKMKNKIKRERTVQRVGRVNPPRDTLRHIEMTVIRYLLPRPCAPEDGALTRKAREIRNEYSDEGGERRRPRDEERFSVLLPVVFSRSRGEGSKIKRTSSRASIKLHPTLPLSH